MCDCQNYRTGPDVICCYVFVVFFSRNTWNMCLLLCYFLRWWKLYQLCVSLMKRPEVITRQGRAYVFEMLWNVSWSPCEYTFINAEQLLWKTQVCELRVSLECNVSPLLLLWPRWGPGRVGQTDRTKSIQTTSLRRKIFLCILLFPSATVINGDWLRSLYVLHFQSFYSKFTVLDWLLDWKQDCWEKKTWRKTIPLPILNSRRTLQTRKCHQCCSDAGFN